MTEQTLPNVTVGVLIFNEEEKILLCKSPKWLHNLYTIPGGHVELGETMVKAAIREIKEEVGLDIYDVEHILAQELIFDPVFFKKKHFVFIEMIAKTKDKEAKIDNDEITSCVWVTPEEGLRIADAYTKNIIKAWMKKHDTNRM
jgi:ADP-ribose pyrophosphatase YjhB (NUDIX family)